MAKPATSLPFAPRGGKNLGKKAPGAETKAKPLKPPRRRKPKAKAKTGGMKLSMSRKGY